MKVEKDDNGVDIEALLRGVSETHLKFYKENSQGGKALVI
jgi:hypothetical protein